jgi:osmotically-inducible protein OsmY
VKLLLTLLLGAAIGAAAVWLYLDGSRKPGHGSAAHRVEAAARDARDSVEDKVRSLNLSGSAITNELARTGRVIRQKAREAGHALSDATADARITAAIKARLVRDPDLSAWNISVNTTDGVVTLSGSASSAENIGKAMLLALETDGVTQVVSTLRVKP